MACVSHTGADSDTVFLRLNVGSHEMKRTKLTPPRVRLSFLPPVSFAPGKKKVDKEEKSISPFHSSFRSHTFSPSYLAQQSAYWLLLVRTMFLQLDIRFLPSAAGSLIVFDAAIFYCISDPHLSSS